MLINDSEYESLLADFRVMGYRVERNDAGRGVERVTVASMPDTTGTITVCRRCVQLYRNSGGELGVCLGAVTLSRQDSADALRKFVCTIMESTDTEYAEAQLRYWAIAFPDE